MVPKTCLTVQNYFPFRSPLISAQSTRKYEVTENHSSPGLLKRKTFLSLLKPSLGPCLVINYILTDNYFNLQKLAARLYFKLEIIFKEFLDKIKN